jgi:hypothetical protein
MATCGRGWRSHPKLAVLAVDWHIDEAAQGSFEVMAGDMAQMHRAPHCCEPILRQPMRYRLWPAVRTSVHVTANVCCCLTSTASQAANVDGPNPARVSKREGLLTPGQIHRPRVTSVLIFVVSG